MTIAAVMKKREFLHVNPKAQEMGRNTRRRMVRPRENLLNLKGCSTQQTTRKTKLNKVLYQARAS
jgi:hypothetical protein